MINFKPASTALRIIAISLAVCGIGTSNGAIAASYAKGETRPGTVIENVAELYMGSGQDMRKVSEASASFTVAPKREPASLQFYVEDSAETENSRPTSKQVSVAQSFYSSSQRAEGPWVETPASSTGGSYAGMRVLHPTKRIQAGTPLYAVLDNNALNYDPNALDRAMLTLRDKITGDTELLTVVETGPDTGVFVALVCTCGEGFHSADGMITTRSRSSIEAFYKDPFDSAYDLADAVTVGPMDPSGLLFDSRTGSPINMVELTIIDASTNLPATVLGDDLTSAFPSTIVTGADVSDASGQIYPGSPGRYRFPYVAPGSYYFVVTPPEGYLAPTKVSDKDIQSLPAGPFQMAQGSRLETFEIATGSTLQIDIPLDGAAIIEVIREGSADVLSIGDFIRYNIKIRAGDAKSLIVDLHDRLPLGLSLDGESLVVDGDRFGGDVDVAADGRSLLIEDIALGADGIAEVSYVARIGLGATGIKTLESSSMAEASGILSNTAVHTLAIDGESDYADAAVVGRLFIGSCEQYQEGADGLGDIRVFAEDGTYVDTDASGRFTFRRLSSGTHVIRLDELSLPNGYEPILCENSTRRAGNATSTFVEVQPGLVQEVAFFLRATDQAGVTLQVQKEPSAKRPSISDFGASWLAARTRDTGIAFPSNRHLPEDKSLDLAVVRTSTQFVEASLNGAMIQGVHKRPSLSAGDRSLDVWRGVELREGENLVRVMIKSLDGAVVKEEAINVLFASDLASLDVLQNESLLDSNGRNELKVVFRASSAEGIPLHPGSLIKINVERPFAFSQIQHGDPDQIASAKIQSTTVEVGENGKFTVYLARSRRSGMAEFSVATDDKPVTQRVYISAQDRPWLLVGLADGTAAHAAISEHMQDPGEQALGQIGSIAISGRAAVFAEGVIAGRWLAAMRLDTGVPGSERSFHAVDPNAQYVVFADKSRSGDGAQSRHALYLRLESDDTEILYGDFDTAIAEGHASYSRRLTGGRVLWGDDTQSLTVFAASTSQSFAENEFPANGTSGPFYLSNKDVLAFSEQVSVVTIARGTNEELETNPLRRGKDYDIDYKSGRIFLSKPLLSKTPNLDRNTLRVSYEIDPKGGDGAILGLRGERSMTDAVTVGATAIHEGNIAGTEGAGRLLSADVKIDISDNVTASAEIAMSHQGASSTIEEDRLAHAAEMRVTYDNDRSTADAYIRSKATAFGISNATSDNETVLSAGVTADLLVHKADPDDDQSPEARLRLDGSTEVNLQTKGALHQAEATWAKTFARTERELGAKMAHISSGNTENDQSSAALKAIGGVSWVSKDDRLELAFGQEITVAKTGEGNIPDAGSLTAAYQVTERLALRGSNEMARNNGAFGNIVHGGFDYEIWEGATATSGISTANGQGHSIVTGQAGFEQSYAITDTLTATGSFDRQSRISGDVSDAGPIAESGLGHPALGETFTALSFGLSFSDDLSSYDVLAEKRFGETKDSARLSGRASRDISGQSAAGLDASFYSEEGHDGTTKSENQVIASAAYRPTDERFLLLDRLAMTSSSDKHNSGLRIANTIQVSKKMRNGDQINLRQGIKWSHSEFDGDAYSDVLGMVGGEYRRDLAEWLDAGIHGSAMYSFGAEDTYTSFGGSVGLTPFDEAWVSLGYNLFGFEDPDFSESGYTDQGAFLQFRLKFDQDSLRDVFAR